MIYREFRTWRKASKYRLRMLFCGLYGLVVRCLIVGLISLAVYIGKQIAAFFRREIIAGCIITFLLVGMGIGWLATFVNERQKGVTAQHAADSLAYELSKFTQMYDTTEAIVINGDTVKWR